jgi:hypothetical protein
MSKVDLEDVRRQITALIAAPAAQQAHTDKLRALSLKNEKRLSRWWARSWHGRVWISRRFERNSHKTSALFAMRLSICGYRRLKPERRVRSVWSYRQKLSHAGHTPAGTTLTRCGQRLFSVEQPFLQLTLRYFKEHCF